MRKKRYIALLAVFIVCRSAMAQWCEYTEEHDDMKYNQFLVEENGTGGLTPVEYYSLLHSNYMKTACETNKTAYRTLTMGDLLIQKDYAQDIDSCLIKRAEIEVLNIADREIDLAWATEKSKVETQMDRFYKNIQHIVLCGGTLADRDRWLQRYDMFDMAISAMRVGESYMPNAERKEQFLKIYEDVTHDNELLVSTLVFWESHAETKKLFSVHKTLSRAKKDSILTDARGRWKVALGNVYDSTKKSE